MMKMFLWIFANFSDLCALEMMTAFNVRRIHITYFDYLLMVYKGFGTNLVLISSVQGWYIKYGGKYCYVLMLN